MMRTLLVPASIVVIGACGFADPGTTTSNAPLIGQNTLTTNALAANGLFANGLFPNGLFPNGLFPNGLFPNGLFVDGVITDALWRDEVWQQNPPALEVLRTNPYTREVLEYIYQCAMRPDQSTTLDPGDGSSVVLEGLIGLAPEWGEQDGTCDLSCQRWVSACLLARTNAYGVTVDISMRAPADAPAHVRKALAVSPEERRTYSLREGAYFGNLFETTPGPDGIATGAPVLYACAGPGSNIPELTKRFCSSQGAGGPITVVGTCESRPEFPHGACEGVSGSPEHGALHHCFTDTDHSLGTEYTEVITVYLKEPIAVCGNSVCEATEADDASCPSDCHPDGWARTFPFLINFEIPPPDHSGHVQVGRFGGISALGPDHAVVMMGSSRSTLDLGGGLLAPGANGDLHGVLVKYDANGRYLWGRRFGPFVNFDPGGVAVASDGSIVATGSALSPTALHPTAWLAKFSANGDLLWNVTSSGAGQAYVELAPVIDGNGNVIVAGYSLSNPIAFGTVTVPPEPTGGYQTFLVKLSPTGVPQWAVRTQEPGHDGPTALALDLHGDVLLGLRSQATGLLKLSGIDGDVVWTQRGQHWAVTSDANGNVYAAGSLDDAAGSPDVILDDSTYAFTLPAGAGPGDFFVARYRGADGAFADRIYTVPMSCSGPAPCPGRFDGRAIAVDSSGNVIVGIYGGNGEPIDFGAGSLATYLTWDVFVAAFSSELAFQWVKHVPMVLDGIHRGMAIDTSSRRIVMSGTYSGSMLIDDRLLVNNVPEQPSNGNTFLASFAMPSLLDVMAPAMSHVPMPTVAEATGPEGAEVFFMRPTAIDTGHAGATVACIPAPSSTFPIGTTQVTCTASDPLGNRSTTTFPVTVTDSMGPAFGDVPPPITVAAAGPTGAVVTFATPAAVDLVDGPRPVTCSHASGAVFPLGTTVVQCLASDTAGHESQTAFAVTVQVGWSGVLPPIDADGTSSFKLGGTIPVKFRLTGTPDPISDAVATLSLVRLSPDPTGTVIAATSAGSSNPGNTFRYNPSSGQYTYELSTALLSAGTWSLRIDLGDGVVRGGTISLHE